MRNIHTRYSHVALPIAYTYVLMMIHLGSGCGPGGVGATGHQGEQVAMNHLAANCQTLVRVQCVKLWACKPSEQIAISNRNLVQLHQERSKLKRISGQTIWQTKTIRGIESVAAGMHAKKVTLDSVNGNNRSRSDRRAQ